MQKRERIFRTIPGFGDRYAIDYMCNLIYVPTKKLMVPATNKEGKEFYILKYNGQRKKYSSTTLRNRAFGGNKNKMIGDVINV